ncbi:MAG: hypothetical protein ACREUV_06365 [Burkholderiales bacterium]
MNPQAIYVKTDKGSEEIQTRKYKLPHKLRTILILIDGNKTGEVLLQQAMQLGAPPDVIQQLEQDGFISAPAAAPASSPRQTAPAPAPVTSLSPEAIKKFSEAYRVMSATVSDALGAKASAAFNLKLEKCLTAEDLKVLLPEYTEAMARVIGDIQAADLSERVRKLLR